MRQFLKICLSVLFITGTSYAAHDRMEEAIVRVNAKAVAQGYQGPALTIDCIDGWYLSNRLLKFQKSERKTFDSLLKGALPDGYGLDYKSGSFILSAKPDSEFAVMSKGRCLDWEAYNLPWYASIPPALDENEFSGTPTLIGTPFPKSVPTRVREIVLALDDARAPALQIDFQVTPANMADLARYFGTGYSVSETISKLTAALEGKPFQWISIEKIFTGWPARWVNLFPAQKAVVDGRSANDVCFGVSRQFFRGELANNGQDRSTEATEYLLKTYYTHLDGTMEPEFGDYLYLPGQHGIRFIMSDPNSGRWIGFTAWSDSHTPYRLWWVDQDYSNPLTGHPIPADLAFPFKMDLWRRIPR